MKSRLLYLYAESPLHAGAAEADGGLDLPIQREATTNYPVVWGQSLKGALRRAVREAAGGDEDVLRLLFGSPPGRGQDTDPEAGGLLVGDAQLVAMPVPTLQRTFAWATSPLALGRLVRKYRHAGVTGSTGLPPVPGPRSEQGMAGAGWTDDADAGTPHVVGPCRVPLLPCASTPGADGSAPEDPVAAWGRRLGADALGDAPHLAFFARKLSEDLLVMGEEVMSVLLRECTELSVRVQLHEDRKTVQNGPFTSEYLPAESVLAAVLTTRDADTDGWLQDALALLFDAGPLHLGGDESIGKGLLWGRLVGGGE